MITINVAQLLKADVGTTREYDINDEVRNLPNGVELTRPVTGRVQFIRTNRGILARAQLHTAARLECSRCLVDFVEDLPINFAEEYIPVVDVHTGVPINVPHESYTYLVNEKHEIDLEPAIREYGLLELPMAPLCRDDCAGLCPTCGVNRNEQTCHCIVDAKDDRFAVLQALLNEDDSN